MASGTPPHLNAIERAASTGQAATARAAPGSCLVINPRSFTVASSRLAARAIALAKAYDAEVVEADHPLHFEAGLDAALARGARRVFVLGGDGTVQAIVDHLARRETGFAMPQLLVLGGGRTNLTAADLHGSGSALKKLESVLVRSARDPAGGFELQHRHTLVMEQTPAPPRHGFFVAGAIVDSLIRRCHQERATGSGSLRTGTHSTAWILMKEAVPALRGRAPYVFPELDLEVPGLGRLHEPMRLLLASTLLHGNRMLDPYADRGEGILRVTAVTAGARGFWQSLPRLVTGRYSEAMNICNGYLSGRCDGFVVRGLDAYTLDGQSFRTDPARPVTVRTGPRFDFLVP
jgi:diacylglycerol kinase (ATP)